MTSSVSSTRNQTISRDQTTGDQTTRDQTTLLRRRLFTSFAALGVLGLLVVAVTSYTVVQWRTTEESLARHYTRSLRLQEVRALTFEAYKEVPDALLGDDSDSRADYERRLTPLGQAFTEWAELAEDDAERAEVATVRAAAEQLRTDSLTVFDLADQGRTAEALAQLELVEERSFEPFDQITTAAVERDRLVRADIMAAAAAARSTATLVLAAAALGVICLILLVAAMLSGGVFEPLRRLTVALRKLADGDTTRLSGDGRDEVAEANRAFNDVATAVERGQLGTDHDTHGPDATGPTLPLRRVSRDASALLHQVLDRFDDELVRRAVSVHLTIDPTAPTLHVDTALMSEALSELVRNSLDAMPDRGGRLGMSCTAHEDGARLEITDDGPGIDPDDIAWIYDDPDPHDRSGPDDDQHGSGLHRATVIVEQHGFRLHVGRREDTTVAMITIPPSDRA